MVGFEKVKPELDALGVSIVASSVDPADKVREVQAEVSFPIGCGVTRQHGNLIGSWWDETRDFIQPSEFLLDETNRVIFSNYSDGPMARFDGADMLAAIRFLESQKK